MEDALKAANPTAAVPSPAVDQLFAQAYAELRQLAHSKLRRSSRITSLDTTSLVHECYVRLSKVPDFKTLERAYLMCYAARAMRSIMVDLVRKRQANGRGGDWQRVTLDPDSPDHELRAAEDLCQVDQALRQLEAVDERLARVVEMKYFGGLSFGDIGLALDVNERTARRDWEKARLWLHDALGR